MVTYRSSAKSLWTIIIQCQGSVFFAVLPYCLLNCSILAVVLLLAKSGVDIAFSPTGHELMTLIISFLVISKVNLGYERYMAARDAIGNALSSLRELNQVVLTYAGIDRSTAANRWRIECSNKIVDLIDCTIRVIKNEEQAAYLAKSEGAHSASSDDPLLLAQSLRVHLYHGCLVLENRLEILERVKLTDLLHEFLLSYRLLLKLASTPLPRPLLQMGRTFLFLWTFSMPLVLRSPFGDASAAMLFLFFLTYGFIGLEVVGLQMMSPFGDEEHDLNISGMRDATITGIVNDTNALDKIPHTSLSQQSLYYGSSKACSSGILSGSVHHQSHQQDVAQSMYHTMESSDITH